MFKAVHQIFYFSLCDRILKIFLVLFFVPTVYLFWWTFSLFLVEKVVVICRLLNADSIHNNQVIQTALSHAFCYLVGSLEDLNTAVSQRTIIYLETIKPSAIRVSLQ